MHRVRGYLRPSPELSDGVTKMAALGHLRGSALCFSIQVGVVLRLQRSPVLTLPRPQATPDLCPHLLIHPILPVTPFPLTPSLHPLSPSLAFMLTGRPCRDSGK